MSISEGENPVPTITWVDGALEVILREEAKGYETYLNFNIYSENDFTEFNGVDSVPTALLIGSMMHFPESEVPDLNKLSVLGNLALCAVTEVLYGNNEDRNTPQVFSYYDVDKIPSYQDLLEGMEIAVVHRENDGESQIYLRTMDQKPVKPEMGKISGIVGQQFRRFLTEANIIAASHNSRERLRNNGIGDPSLMLPLPYSNAISYEDYQDTRQNADDTAESEENTDLASDDQRIEVNIVTAEVQKPRRERPPGRTKKSRIKKLKRAIELDQQFEQKFNPKTEPRKIDVSEAPRKLRHVRKSEPKFTIKNTEQIERRNVPFVDDAYYERLGRNRLSANDIEVIKNGQIEVLSFSKEQREEVLSIPGLEQTFYRMLNESKFQGDWLNKFGFTSEDLADFFIFHWMPVNEVNRNFVGLTRDLQGPSFHQHENMTKDLLAMFFPHLQATRIRRNNKDEFLWISKLSMY